MRSVVNVKDCYGCGVCSVVCKYNLIDVKLNRQGFYEPQITDINACVQCGMCTKVCSFLNDFECSYPLYSYVAWSKNPKVLKASTSGGVSYEVAQLLITKGYKFCGVRYNVALHRAEHYIASDNYSLSQSIGSKYLQSYTKEAFKEINRHEKYLVVGTPCQIASFRRYIEVYNCKHNFVLMDFFCHGVPSYLVWKKYLNECGGKLGKINHVTWRNKLKGWQNSYCVFLDGEKGKVFSWNGKDDFFTMFLGNACLGKACYNNCKFKYNSSAADIRIGDYWGGKYKSNPDGVSSVIAFSEIGNGILQASNLEIHEYPFEIVVSGQMRCNPRKPWFYDLCMNLIKNDNSSLSKIAKYVRFHMRIYGHIKTIRLHFSNIFNQQNSY